MLSHWRRAAIVIRFPSGNATASPSSSSRQARWFLQACSTSSHKFPTSSTTPATSAARQPPARRAAGERESQPGDGAGMQTVGSLPAGGGSVGPTILATRRAEYTLSKDLRFALDAISYSRHRPLHSRRCWDSSSPRARSWRTPCRNGVTRNRGSYLPGSLSHECAGLLLGGSSLIAIGIIFEYVGRTTRGQGTALYLVRSRRKVAEHIRPEPASVPPAPAQHGRIGCSPLTARWVRQNELLRDGLDLLDVGQTPPARPIPSRLPLIASADRFVVRWTQCGVGPPAACLRCAQ